MGVDADTDAGAVPDVDKDTDGDPSACLDTEADAGRDTDAGANTDADLRSKCTERAFTSQSCHSDNKEEKL